MNTRGSIRILTGDGKGKTTTALGMAFHAADWGRKVFMVQFLKAPETSGEHFSAKILEPMITIKAMGRRGFIRHGSDPADVELAQSALEEAKNAMISGEYEMVILDEVNYAVYLGLINEQHLLELMDSKSERLDLILTGRYASSEVIGRADVVLEMKKTKVI
jgi:cob(I)alamin adenosyltransferase